jgi:hypothetical protein
VTNLGWQVLIVSYSEYSAGNSRVSMPDLCDTPTIRKCVDTNPQELKECLLVLREDGFLSLHNMYEIRVLGENPSVEYRDNSFISITDRGIEWVGEHTEEDDENLPIGFRS